MRSPKIDPLMSAPRSPTGKRLSRPIVSSSLPKRLTHDDNAANVRRILWALVIAIALLSILVSVLIVADRRAEQSRLNRSAFSVLACRSIYRPRVFFRDPLGANFLQRACLYG
jgi:hypothetical protein